LTPNEEKVLCKQIADLEKSLPYAEPLEKIDKRMEVVRQEKSKIGKVMNEIFTKLKDLDTEINSYKDNLDEMDKNKEESKNSLDPTI